MTPYSPTAAIRRAATANRANNSTTNRRAANDSARSWSTVLTLWTGWPGSVSLTMRRTSAARPGEIRERPSPPPSRTERPVETSDNNTLLYRSRRPANSSECGPLRRRLLTTGPVFPSPLVIRLPMGSSSGQYSAMQEFSSMTATDSDSKRSARGKESSPLDQNSHRRKVSPA